MDNELEAIRARRLQELQQQHQAAKGPSGSGDDGQARQEKKEKEDEFRNTILSQILSQEARARLNTIKTAKPEKGKMLEDILINNARMGAISSKLSENDLKSILERVSQQFNKETKVQFDRRRACIDSDDDE